MTQTHIDALNEWLGWRNLTQTDVTEQFEVVGSGVTPNKSYYKCDGLTEVVTKRGIFYFDENGTFVLLFLSARRLRRAEDITVDTLRGELGKSDKVLKSRGGPAALLQIYPELGMAFSSDNFELHYMEIFQPTDFDTYRKTFYEEPLYRR